MASQHREWRLYLSTDVTQYISSVIPSVSRKPPMASTSPATTATVKSGPDRALSSLGSSFQLRSPGLYPSTPETCPSSESETIEHPPITSIVPSNATAAAC
mmetsp:Transcript_146130/g.255175  ORF Transcript_146130/g.255175 Transcript_146130/m.255175 type:complete len:101 (-) Transcript_146130:67-369(-)